MNLVSYAALSAKSYFCTIIRHNKIIVSVFISRRASTLHCPMDRRELLGKERREMKIYREYVLLTQNTAKFASSKNLPS